MVIERGIAAGYALQSIVEIENDLVQRQLIYKHHTIFGHVLESPLNTTLLLQQGENTAEERVTRQYCGLDIGFLDLLYTGRIGHLRWRIDLVNRAIGRGHAISHAGRGRDQLKVE